MLVLVKRECGKVRGNYIKMEDGKFILECMDGHLIYNKTIWVLVNSCFNYSIPKDFV